MEALQRYDIESKGILKKTQQIFIKIIIITQLRVASWISIMKIRISSVRHKRFYKKIHIHCEDYDLKVWLGKDYRLTR